MCGDLEIESATVEVDSDRVAVFDHGDRAAPNRLGRDVSDHQAASGAREAAVGDQRHRFAESGAHHRRGQAEHLAHPGTAGRPFVAHDQDVACFHVPCAYRLDAGPLVVEHTGRAGLPAPLGPRDLDYRAVRRDAPAERVQRPAWLEPADHLAVGGRRGVADLGQRPALDCWCGAVERVAAEQLPDQRGRPSDAVQILGHPAPARGEFGDHRRPAADRSEIVE